MNIKGIFKQIIENRYIFISLIIIIAIIVFGIIGYFYQPYSPEQSFASNLPPSTQHILGTNFFGNDLFSQLLVAVLPTVAIAFLGAALALIFAIVIGLLSGYYRGYKNEFLNFFINVFLLIPGLPLAIVISSDLETSHINISNVAIALVIFITAWAFGARTIRSQVLSLSSRDYIRFIKHTGESDLKIVFTEILPSLLPYIGYIFTSIVVYSVITETSLLFLGLGDESQITLGSMLYFANVYSGILLGDWWWFIPPGVIIALLGIGFGLLSFGLDTIANPSLRVFKKRKSKIKIDMANITFENDFKS
ncbi:MAG: ABC transporter permease [Thermoplasmata archaeon]